MEFRKLLLVIGQIAFWLLLFKRKSINYLLRILALIYWKNIDSLSLSIPHFRLNICAHLCLRLCTHKSWNNPRLTVNKRQADRPKHFFPYKTYCLCVTVWWKLLFEYKEKSKWITLLTTLQILSAFIIFSKFNCIIWNND